MSEEQPIRVSIETANAIISLIQKITGLEFELESNDIPFGNLIGFTDFAEQEGTFYVLICETCYGSNYKHMILIGSCNVSDKLDSNIQNPEELLDNSFINLCYKWSIEALQVFIRDTENNIAENNESIQRYRKFIQNSHKLLGLETIDGNVWTEEDIEDSNRCDTETINRLLQDNADKETAITSAKSRLATI